MRQAAVIFTLILLVCRPDVAPGVPVDQQEVAASRRGSLPATVGRRQWEAAYGGLGSYPQDQPDYNSYDIHREPWQSAPDWNSNSHDSFAYGPNSDNGFDDSAYDDEYDDDASSESNDYDHQARALNLRRAPIRRPPHRRPAFTKASKRSQRTETDEESNDYDHQALELNLRRAPIRLPAHRRPAFTKASKRSQRTETDQTEAEGKKRLMKVLENLREAARKRNE